MADKLIIAHKGGGKTTFIRSLVTREQAAGRLCGGVLSEAVVMADRRIGYDAIDLRTGVRSVLARISATMGSPPSVGNYQFADAGFRLGVEAVLDALQRQADVIVIDEIGPLEVRGEGWANVLRQCLDNADPSQCLVIAARPSLVDVLPEAFPSPRWKTAERITPDLDR